MAIKYTDEMKDYLKEIVPGKHYKDVLVLFNNKFKTDLSISALKSALKRFGILNGVVSTFKKGSSPWNKGKKGLSKANRTSFKKGNKPANFRPVGSERIDRDGYTLIKINNEGSMWERWTSKHKYLWEKYNGRKVPPGYVVIFADQNNRNFEKENLILVSRAELLKLNRKKLIFDNSEATKAGLNTAKLMLKIDELKRRKKI